MARIFLSFANSQQHPLVTLQEEDDKVYSILSRREEAKHFRIHRDSFSTIPKIAEYLVLFQDDIILFHFGGHAGQDKLLLNDTNANAKGIAKLLGSCKNLKLVILNGCSSKGQVSALLSSGVPIVIATSAPVGDRAATQFAISFYQSLGDLHENVGSAFQTAIGAAQTESAFNLNPETKSRDINFSEEEFLSEDPLWGLYYQNEIDLEWKLPIARYIQQEEYIPNRSLIQSLLNSLAPFDPEVGKIQRQEEMGIEASLGEKKIAILKCLPHPISQQLRKLMSKEKGMEEHIFYDKAGPERLNQICHTYITMIELLSFILLADLWQTLENNSDLNLKTPETTTLNSFFVRQFTVKKPFNFVELIRTVREIMESLPLPLIFFMEEFRKVSQSFNEDTSFAAACRFLEALSFRNSEKNSISEEESFELCPIAENKLAIILGELGFLATYSLSSVRAINVLKYRYPHGPLFNHRVIPLAQEFLELEEKVEILEKYMDSSSVILKRKVGNSFQFLNLSPFVIDESAFDVKADLAKLFFFVGYDKDSDTLRYRHVYKSADPNLAVSDQKHFRILRTQFDALCQTFFHKSPKDL